MLTIYCKWTLAQMMVVGRVHRELGTPVMSYLPPEHALNTVHVHDLARALWHAATWYRDSGREGPEIFNVSDLGNSSKSLEQTITNQH
jgi:nucleoside-diphosphate-sugar epimerase